MLTIELKIIINQV